MALIVGLQQEREIRHLHAGKAVVFEIDQDEGFPGRPGGEQVRHALEEKAGLATAPHADDRQGLARDGGQADFPAGDGWNRCNQRIVELALEGLPDFSFHRGGYDGYFSF